MQENTNNILYEVRKSYRLLFQYQARILDLMGFIGDSFECKYKGGYPRFSNSSPNKGRGRLDNWAWDWLNMYYYEFNFTRKLAKINFSVFLLNDTGFYEAKFQEKKIHEKKISAFESSENSNSKLIFVASKKNRTEWSKIWSYTSFTLNETGQIDSGDEIMIFKSYALENFFSEDTTIEILKDFENYCESYDLVFRYKEKTV
ncbi:hypothetical protein [Flavobacterium reichenbachii]|uniref:Uncharacterized protein n=1 Tax=Flavobacterium reichenbachii TaxID=362418 RepID=A0A085ZPF2_9FLAO|nr:hypothetical protein [Flavobacterium reichenbachii]KFF06316.1 hypothetical protein IW19_12605 [Flavobacterium reichenbachii]OXB17470.1 hypothetical protein B0A68_04010 [Flavobacterium reichenbachii]